MHLRQRRREWSQRQCSCKKSSISIKQQRIMSLYIILCCKTSTVKLPSLSLSNIASRLIDLLLCFCAKKKKKKKKGTQKKKKEKSKWQRRSEFTCFSIYPCLTFSPLVTHSFVRMCDFCVSDIKLLCPFLCLSVCLFVESTFLYFKLTIFVEAQCGIERKEKRKEKKKQ